MNLRQTKYFPERSSLCLGVVIIIVFFVVTINVIEVDTIECGTVNLYREAMLGAEEVVKDEWPFIAALYYSETFKYFCGGTIISHKHVLTAAHCIQMKFKGVALSPNDILVRLGAYNLTDRSEKDVADRNVTQICVHPDWNINDEKYDADIAILVLNENITFSNNIRLICMPPGNYLIDGLVGTVVGWGKTENHTAEGIARKIEVTALNDTYCYNRDNGIARYASGRSFCGEGSGVPNGGDSGGGFFAVAGSGWVQFGTVSFARPKETGSALKVAMYMKLPSLRDWIADKVEQSGGIVQGATMSANLSCIYLHNRYGVYSCVMFDVNIRQENFVVKEFTGTHYYGNDNEDVELIAFRSGIMASLPHNFGNIFKNLKIILMHVNTRRIFRSNFQNLDRLKILQFVNSSIGMFDENSLWDLPNLESFHLKKNDLKLLDPAMFSRNYKLKDVQVWSNDLTSLPGNLFRNNLMLESVFFNNNSIAAIDETIFETNSNLMAVSLRGNRLRHLNKALFQNNAELQFIDLSNNFIKTIEEQTFKTNSKLLTLRLESNELKFVPAQLLQGMEFLQEILLDENALKLIDEQFFETNGRILQIFLQSNQLTHIQANLFRNNSRLRSVDLSKNSLGAIDENLFEKNVLLQKVSFQINRLVELPSSLFKHNSMLKLVNVRSNLLESIDEGTFQWNTGLLEIYLDNNYVSSLPRKLLQNNVLLEIFGFGINVLETIDENFFEANVNLLEVHLHSNLLTHIPKNLFRNNLLLEIVKLSNNLFTILNENTFSQNTNLAKIFLQEGALQSLPLNLFRNNGRLKYIDLSNNLLKLTDTNFTALSFVGRINLSGNL